MGNTASRKGKTRNRLRIPGLALAVFKDGRVIKAKGYGLANVELNVQVTPESVFQRKTEIASSSESAGAKSAPNPIAHPGGIRYYFASLTERGRSSVG